MKGSFIICLYVVCYVQVKQLVASMNGSFIICLYVVCYVQVKQLVASMNGSFIICLYVVKDAKFAAVSAYGV